MIKINKHLKKIHNKSEEDRTRIMWVSVVFCMIIILSGWFIIYKLSNPDNYKNKIAEETSRLPSFSDLQKSIDDMNHQKEDFFEEATDIAQKAEIESIALIYIKENELASDDNILNLKLENMEKLEDNWHLKYRQYHQDILVNDSDISFLINDTEKKVVSYSFNFDPDIDLSNIEPKITKEEAYKIAKENLSADLDNENFDLKNSELVIYKKENKTAAEHFLTWKLDIFSLQPLCDYHYFIDADNGNIVYSFDDRADI